MSSPWAKHRREVQIVRAACQMLGLRVVGGSSYYTAISAALKHDTRVPKGGLLYHETKAMAHSRLPTGEPKEGTLYLIFDPSKTSDDFIESLSSVSLKLGSRLKGEKFETVIVLWSGEPHKMSFGGGQ